MKIKFFNTFINVVQKESYLEKFIETFSNNTKIFYYLNTYSFYLINKDPYYCKIFNNADFISADGYSIVLACKYLLKKNTEKLTPTRLITTYLIPFWIKMKYKIFILGGEKEHLNFAIKNIQNKYPDLNISGWYNGFFVEEKNQKIIRMINDSDTDILLVGMGMPVSELWIENHKNRLNVKYIITVGAFVDFMSGRKKLAPYFLHNSIFEWMFRLIQEPERLFMRYLKAHLFFLKTVLQEYLRSKA